MRGAGPLRCWSSANEAAGATKGASLRRSSGAPRRNMRRKQQALRVVTSETARLGLNASEVEIDGAVASAIERQRETPFVSVEVERTGETTAPFNIFFPGILTMMVMFAVTLNAISIVEERLDGRLERLLTTGSGLNGIFAGKFLAGYGPGLHAGVHIGHARLGCFPVIRPGRLRRNAGSDRCFGRICTLPLWAWPSPRSPGHENRRTGRR